MVSYNMDGGDVVDSYKVNKLENDSYKIVYDSGVRYVEDYYFDYLGRPVYVIDVDSTQGVSHRVKLVKDNDEDEDNYGFRKRSAVEKYWKGKYYDEKKAKDKVLRDKSKKKNDDSSYVNYYSNVFRKYVKVKCYDSPPKGKLFYKKC